MKLNTFAYENTSALTIIIVIASGIVGIASGIVFSLLITGILFKVNLWQGGNWLIMVGASAIGFLWLIIAIFLSKKHPVFHKQMFLRSIVLGGIGLIFLFTPNSALADAR